MDGPKPVNTLDNDILELVRSAVNVSLSDIKAMFKNDNVTEEMILHSLLSNPFIICTGNNHFSFSNESSTMPVGSDEEVPLTNVPPIKRSKYTPGRMHMPDPTKAIFRPERPDSDEEVPAGPENPTIDDELIEIIVKNPGISIKDIVAKLEDSFSYAFIAQKVRSNSSIRCQNDSCWPQEPARPENKTKSHTPHRFTPPASEDSDDAEESFPKRTVSPNLLASWRKTAAEAEKSFPQRSAAAAAEAVAAGEELFQKWSAAAAAAEERFQKRSASALPLTVTELMIPLETSDTDDEPLCPNCMHVISYSRDKFTLNAGGRCSNCEWPVPVECYECGYDGIDMGYDRYNGQQPGNLCGGWACAHKGDQRTSGESTGVHSGL